MSDIRELEQNASAGQESAALVPLASPEPSDLTPAERQLRQLVVDSVTAQTSKLAYGVALDHLFSFSAGLRPEPYCSWKAGMEGLAPSSINVRLSAVRKLFGEARHNGMLGVEEAADLTDIPNVRQQGTRLGNWLTREQAKEFLAISDRSTIRGTESRDPGSLGRMCAAPAGTCLARSGNPLVPRGTPDAG